MATGPAPATDGRRKPSRGARAEKNGSKKLRRVSGTLLRGAKGEDYLGAFGEVEGLGGDQGAFDEASADCYGWRANSEFGSSSFPQDIRSRF